MARFSEISILAAFLLILSACDCQPRPHDIGDGLAPEEKRSMFLMFWSVLLDVNIPSFAKDNMELDKQILLQAENLLETSVASIWRRKMSAAQHPRLRGKRSTTCQFSQGIPKMIKEIKWALNDSLFVGLNPWSWTSAPIIQRHENLKCPTDGSTPQWWQVHKEENLRALCPWVYEQDDLGEGFFPRYVPKARCLCVKCIQAEAMRCKEMEHTIPVFKLQKCHNGFALFNKMTWTINVGCFCVSANQHRK